MKPIKRIDAQRTYGTPIRAKRLEGRVKNAGIRPKRKQPKSR